MKRVKGLSALFIIGCCLLMILAFIGQASASEEYVFERIWPVLPQPWYFNNPSGVAVDDADFVYVTDSYNHCIKKLTSNGMLVTKWGSRGSGYG